MRSWIAMLISMILICAVLPVGVDALDLTAPAVPPAGKELMPEDASDFSDGLIRLLRKAVGKIRPDLAEAASICFSVMMAVMAVSLMQCFGEKGLDTVRFAGSTVVAVLLLSNANSLIHLSTQTIRELTDYGKLLFPVMTAALAAQGGVSSSAALYTGTAAFDLLLSSLISALLVPMVYLYLVLAIANGALGEDLLKNMRDMAKSVVSWSLKTVLTVFTTYMSITGVVSGTTDAAALKATKVAISSVVPFVGGVLSDASESILVSAGLVKSAAGVYGILAILAVFLGPFLKIGVHYLMLKATAAVCSIFGTKSICAVIGDFAAAMGLLLAMTGSVCLLLLISTVCFMKGVAI